MVKPYCVSLFDLSGVWSRPWRATHRVVRWDLQAGFDVLDCQPDMYDRVDCVLAAPPCTHFTKAGARWWPACDQDGRTDQHVALVNHVLDLVEAWRPRVFALENPVGRLPRLVPRLTDYPRFTFHPWQYAGERAVKSTVIWGQCRQPEPRPEPPCDPGGGHTVTSWIGPGPERANLRSKTPLGFSRAFYLANRP